MSKNRRLEFWAVAVAAVALIQACAWIADLGPAKQRAPENEPASGGRSADGGGDGDGAAGADSPQGGAAGAADLPDVAHPAIGILSASGGVVCTASLIGPRTALTAASCLPAVGRGCEQEIPDSQELRFTLALNPPRTFHVRAFEPYPLAFPLSGDDSCDGLCSLFAQNSIADVRRGRDLALIYMALDSDLREPGYYADPLRVITQPELPRSNEASSEISSFDIDRDFRDGSQMRPRFVGFGTKSDSLGLIQREGAGRFDLGPFWNVGCEQVVRCTTGENRRNRCPSIPFATNADFFEDSVLRVLDVADQPWLSSFYNGSSGAALLLEGSPRKGAANPVQAGSNTLIGVLSDSETSVTGRPSDRPAAYFAPTFAAGVGGWLERRIGDFDADCDPDDSDDSPTVANASSSCSDDQNRLREAGWSRVSLDSQLAAPTLPALAWSPRGSVAAAAHDALSLDLFVVSGDGTLYRARAVPEIDWNQLKWSPWAPIAVRGQLRGELSAVARGSDVLLCGLTVEQQLRCFTVDAAGEAFEEAAPNPAGAGFFSSGPAAVPAPFATTGDIDLFIRGGDGVLLRYEQRGGTWEELVELVEPKTGDIDDKAAVLTSPPVATVAGNKIELFARGSKFELLHWTIDSDASPRFSERIGDMVMEGVPAVYSSSADRVAVLSRDGTGALLQLVREGINSFWRPVGTQLLTNPVPVVPAPGYVHLFAMSEPDKFLSLMRHE